MKKTIINVGDRFNFWEVLKVENDTVEVFCHGCSKTIKTIKRRTLLSGRSKSCGCQKTILLRKHFKQSGIQTKKDLIYKGLVHQQWIVLEDVPSNSNYIKVQCKICNNKNKVCYRRLLNNKVQCKCSHIKNKIKIGSQFSYWTVINNDQSKKVQCKCQCGEIRNVNVFSLINNKTKSCGCMTKQIRQQTNLEKFGITNPLQDHKVREKQKQKQISLNQIHMLDGKTLRERCLEANVPPASAGLVLKMV